MPEILRSLRHRNYRLYFSGQVASLAGTWMQQIAMSWLVYRLTGSVLLLGTVAFAGQIPVLLMAPLGGLIADRVDRRKLLLATQATALGQSLVLAVLTLTAAIAPWHLVALARDEGKTVLLAHHGLDQAAALADRVCVVHHGRVHLVTIPEARQRLAGTGSAGGGMLHG